MSLGLLSASSTFTGGLSRTLDTVQCFELLFWVQAGSPVHLLWPLSGDEPRTKLDVIFFHGLQFTENDICDSWRRTWSQRGHEDVCWPQVWLPNDLGGDVRIFAVSYNAHAVTSPHDDVSEIAHNLFQSLMNSRCQLTLFHYRNALFIRI